MNYYFLPRVAPLKSFVTLAAFSPAGENASGRPFRVYAAYADGTCWRVFPLGPIAPGKALRFSEDDLPREFPPDRTAFLFLHPEELPAALPELFVNELMHTVPAWRANIQLKSPTTAVSYQGEYPDTMLGLSKGTLVSIAPLVSTVKGTATELILANMQKKPVRETKTLLLASMRKRKVVAELTAWTNECSVIALPGLSSADDPLCVFSREITGVPLYLSHDADYRHLSLEHSHPPAELTVFGDEDDRRQIISRMKKWWLENVTA